VAVLAGTGVIVLAAGRPAQACWWDPVVFDPQALVERVQEVAQLVQQVETAAQQVQNQLREMAHLGGGVAPDVAGTVEGARTQLDPVAYGSSQAAEQLDAQFPMQMTDVSWGQYQSMCASWTDAYRQTLIENRKAEDAVYRDMDATAQRVRGIVEASNAAPGETAAVQAHNDLVAVASAEVAKLQVLKATRSRARAERLAREQSEAAFGAAERERVRAGWAAPVPPSGALGDAFGE
jgi:P-type conjugative transfer protein TrbJ